MSKVCVIGGATWDVLLATNEAKLVPLNCGTKKQALAFLYGAKIDVTGSEYSFGGGAANVAVGLSRLEVDCDIYTRLGNDWRAREIINHLRQEKVDINQITYDDKLYSAVSLIITAGGAHEHIALVDRGATVNLFIKPEFAHKNYEWFYLTSIANPKWYKFLPSFLKRAKELGKRIFWNPGSLQLKQITRLKPLLKYLEVLDVNYDEAIDILGKTFKFNKIKNILSSLLKLGPKIVIMTAGRKGVYVASENKFIYQKSFAVHPVNTIGAGDSFGSGFLAGFIKSNGNLKQATLWGMANSNSVIMHSGAQKGLLKQRELKSFIKRYV